MKQADRPVVQVTGPPDIIPTYESRHAAGADLKANIPSPMTVDPGERVLVPTGLHMAIPRGWEGQVRPRSGLALKHGLTVLNAPGTIDSDYRGEVKVILVNLGSAPVTIEPNMRVAQLVIASVQQAVFQDSTNLPDSERGSGGFGSTGH